MWTLNLTHQTTLILSTLMVLFLFLGPKIQAAPDFGSCDGTGFKQFEQYLAKNGKKQPKAESVASDEVVPVLGKNRCALGKCVSQKSCL